MTRICAWCGAILGGHGPVSLTASVTDERTMDSALYEILRAALRARKGSDSEATRVCDALIAVILACEAGLCIDTEDCLRAIVDGANGTFEHEGTSFDEMVWALERNLWDISNESVQEDEKED